MNVSRILSSFRYVSRMPEVMRCLGQLKGGFGIVCGYLGIRTLAYPTDMVWKSGTAINLKSWEDLTTVWAIYFRNEYVLLPTDKTVIDLGGNIGAFVKWVAEERPQAKIFVAEPFPETFAHMQHTIDRNHLGDRVTALALAVGGEDGTIQFDARPTTASHSRQMYTDADEVQGEVINVPMISLESLYQKIGLQEVDVIKSNVEGAEYEIFGKASTQTLRRMKRLLLEYHKGDYASLFKKLESAGLKMTFNHPGKLYCVWERQPM